MRLLAASLLAAALATPAAAFPDRPITVVLPYSPGSATDAYARALGDHMARVLGQNVVVTNRDGGSGVVGMRSVAASPAGRPHHRPHAHDGHRRAAAPGPQSRHRPGKLRARLRHERERHRRRGARRQPGARPARAGGARPRAAAFLRQRRPELPAAARSVARPARGRERGLHPRALPGRPAALERAAGRAPRLLLHRRRLRQRADRTPAGCG